MTFSLLCQFFRYFWNGCHSHECLRFFHPGVRIDRITFHCCWMAVENLTYAHCGRDCHRTIVRCTIKVDGVAFYYWTSIQKRIAWITAGLVSLGRVIHRGVSANQLLFPGNCSLLGSVLLSHYFPYDTIYGLDLGLLMNDPAVFNTMIKLIFDL